MDVSRLIALVALIEVGVIALLCVGALVKARPLDDTEVDDVGSDPIMPGDDVR